VHDFAFADEGYDFGGGQWIVGFLKKRPYRL
jgi:hypothetical protein